MKGKMGKDCYAKGGKVDESTDENPDARDNAREIEEEAEGKEPKMKHGGRAKKRRHGGKVEGEAHKMHMGRAGRHKRARGGGVGSDHHPETSADKPKWREERERNPDDHLSDAEAKEA